MNTTRCQDLEEDLAALAAGAAEESEAIRTHLDGCAPCRERLAEYRSLAAALPAPEVVSDELAAVLHRRVMDSVRPRRLPMLRAVAAVLIAAVGFSAWSWFRPDPPAPVAQEDYEPVLFAFGDEPEAQVQPPSMWSYREALMESPERLEKRLHEDAGRTLNPGPDLLATIQRKSI